MKCLLLALLLAGAEAEAQPDPRRLTPAPVITGATLTAEPREHGEYHYWEVAFTWDNPGHADDECGKNPVIEMWADDDGEWTYWYNVGSDFRLVDPGPALYWNFSPVLDESVPGKVVDRRDKRTMVIEWAVSPFPEHNPYPMYVYAHYSAQECHSDVSNVIKLEHQGAVPAMPLGALVALGTVLLLRGWRGR